MDEADGRRGEPGRCGWLKDKFGVSWQVIPKTMTTLLGGGGDANYTLDLRLSSATPAPQQPEKGDHFFLPVAKMGKSVPLWGDAPGKSEPVERDYNPGQMEKPKGLWSRPSAPCAKGVRPNSPAQTTSVWSRSPRALRSRSSPAMG